MMMVRDIDLSKQQGIVLPGCMITYSGIVFDLMNIDPEAIILGDIAHGLAFQPRWNGATKQFYSIAEHSLRVADRVEEDKKLTALFHDSEEFAWGDMISPLKEIIKIHSPEVLEKMKELRFAIYEKYGIVNWDVRKEDKEEVMCDFHELILSDNRNTLSPEQAESDWLIEVLKRIQCKYCKGIFPPNELMVVVSRTEIYGLTSSIGLCENCRMKWKERII